MSQRLASLIKKNKRELFRLQHHRFYDGSKICGNLGIPNKSKQIINSIRKICLASESFIREVLGKEIDPELRMSRQEFLTASLFSDNRDLNSIGEKILREVMLEKHGSRLAHLPFEKMVFPFTDQYIQEEFEEISNTYRFQPSFEKMAEETELDKNFGREDVKPLSRFSILKFNPYDLESYIELNSLGDKERWFQIESAYIWHENNKLLMKLNLAGFSPEEYLSDAFFGFVMPIEADENGIEKATINEEIVRQVIVGLISQELYSFSWEAAEQMVIRCLRKILNVMIYMGADNYYAEEIDAKRKNQEEASKMGRKKRRSFLESRENERDYIIIGRPRPKSTEGAAGGGPAYTVSPHYRRAHWRRQRYGPGRELTKNIFIEGLFVHEEKTDVPIKKKNYIIRGSKQEYQGVINAREKGEI